MELVRVEEIGINFPRSLDLSEIVELLKFISRIIPCKVTGAKLEHFEYDGVYEQDHEGPLGISGCIRPRIVSYGVLDLSYTALLDHGRYTGLIPKANIRRSDDVFLSSGVVALEDNESKLWKDIGDKVAEYFNTRK